MPLFSAQMFVENGGRNKLETLADEAPSRVALRVNPPWVHEDVPFNNTMCSDVGGMKPGRPGAHVAMLEPLVLEGLAVHALSASAVPMGEVPACSKVIPGRACTGPLRGGKHF